MDLVVNQTKTNLEKIDDEKDLLQLNFLKSLKWMYYMGLIFVIMLVVKFLPLTEMELGENTPRFIHWIQRWAIAFFETSSTLLIGLGALIVSAFVKEGFEMLRAGAKKDRNKNR